jgi:enoyl-CoA hydratase/carnithine racemase
LSETVLVEKRGQVAKITLNRPEALEQEATLQHILGRTEDHAEAVKAFLEKRKPKFTGN